MKRRANQHRETKEYAFGSRKVLWKLSKPFREPHDLSHASPATVFILSSNVISLSAFCEI